jgi:hypothetical protein
MGKDKVQKLMANFAPLLICFGSLMVVTTCSFRKLVTYTIDACTRENFWEIVIDTLINFPVSWSYV